MHDPIGWHSRGYLPHYDSPDTVQHIVFRTIGSLPRHFLAELPKDSESRTKAVEVELDACADGCILADPRAASIVEETMLYFDGSRYLLQAWCVMPNHVHVLAEIVAGFSMGAVVKSWKTYSAKEINKICGSIGAVWALDYFDRYMRDEADIGSTIGYVENNPVKAGLVDAPEHWPWSSARRRQLDREPPARKID